MMHIAASAEMNNETGWDINEVWSFVWIIIILLSFKGFIQYQSEAVTNSYFFVVIISWFFHIKQIEILK